jgi:hypothetical protein
MLGKEEHVTALIAPAIEGQFPGKLSQIKAALLAAGFSSVLEVSEGLRRQACMKPRAGRA